MSGFNDLYLTPLTGEPKIKPHATLDLESKALPTLRDPSGQAPGFERPFLAGFYDGTSFLSFRDDPLTREDFPTTAWLEPGGCIDLLCRFLFRGEGRSGGVMLYSDTNIYAHNGGNFDFLFLLPWLARNAEEYIFEIVPVQTSIQLLEVKQRGKGDQPKKNSAVWRFLDSIRLLPMGLDKAAKAFGLEGKVSHDLRIHEDDPSWEIYLKGDCVQLYDTISRAEDMIVNRFRGELGITLPATAMRLYRRAYLGKHGAPKKIPRHRHFSTCEDT